jgi:hypothetical protein
VTRCTRNASFGYHLLERRYGMNQTSHDRHCCVLAIGLFVSLCVSGCSDATSIEGVSANRGAKIDIAGTRTRADEMMTELNSTSPTEERLREIVVEIHRLEQCPELTDLELSDLREAASARWSEGGHSVPPKYRELQAGVEERGGTFEEIPLSRTVLAYLKDTQISDGDLAALPGLEHVTTLVLWNVGSITDAGMEHIARRCQNLRVLDLRATSVTDAGLVQLESIKTLRKVLAGKTQATDDGVTRMQSVLKPRNDADMTARMEVAKQRRQTYEKRSTRSSTRKLPHPEPTRMSCFFPFLEGAAMKRRMIVSLG